MYMNKIYICRNKGEGFTLLTKILTEKINTKSLENVIKKC